ncbi:MAG TPA: hypothetical protein VIS95_04315 [Solirubrobacterales bacterium]
MAALSLALPQAAAGAEAESVVPPENSAATQYTEALPTSGGDKEAGGGHKPTPAKVLGSKNAHKLQSQGKDGREVAQIAAETAPETIPPAGSSSPTQGEPAPTGGSGHADENGNGGDSSGKADRQQHAEPAPTHTAQPTASELPDGSAGLGEVLGEATGSSSSGGIGLLLPLAIVAAIAWALAFLRRQRRPAE